MTPTDPDRDTHRRALVIGKFLPPHRGHQALIARAVDRAVHVDVIVCDEPGQRPAAATRAEWLRDLYPEGNVTVHVVADICGWHANQPCPPQCSAAWADHLPSLGFEPWDLVVTSEPYGAPFAEQLGAAHESFDPARTQVPVSGTEIRADLASGWRWLHPVVRRGLTRKVVIVGAESTGTTTLSTALAAELGADWVPEVARAVSAELSEEFGSIWDIEWTAEHFVRIAEGQDLDEADRLDHWVDGEARFGPLGPWLVCDTDLLATAIWHERYLGSRAPDLIERGLAPPRQPTLYVLTSLDGVLFEQDGLRDGEHLRAWMTDRFRAVLAASGVPWIEVTGDPHERVATVLAHLAEQPPPLFQPGQKGPSKA